MQNETYRTVWECYVAAWKARSAKEKKTLFQECLEPESIYRDPIVEVSGWDALCQYMLDFHQQVPGGYFATQYFLAHHNRSISRWHMLDESGTLLGEGISYGEYGDSGLLTHMTGFFEVPDQA